MFTPISIDSSFLSLSADLLPDTSGLAPLSLPPEFLRSQPLQAPDAVLRFQSALPGSMLPSESASQETSPAQLSAFPLHTIPVAPADRQNSSSPAPPALDSSPHPQHSQLYLCFSPYVSS